VRSEKIEVRGKMVKGEKTAAGFRRIKPEAIKDNPFQAMEGDWFLLTAGTLKSYNTMTCGWGAWGVLWSRPAVFVFVRPTRHTYGFANKSDTFTVCFFPKKYRKALQLCGTRSGRDCDKAKETGLTPARAGNGSVFFREARLVLECRKIYQQDLDPRLFLDPGIGKCYPKKDYHRMYVGQVTRVMVRK
jgi:flavin reductase (DIM6/NTAB) family NADH-FMN oxidoreductase RutF